MKVHEYQAKELFAAYGIPVPRGRAARTPEEAEEIAAEIGGRVVVKAQIHAGGRGKAGGIRTAENPQEARKIAEELLGKTLVTFQTGPQGAPVNVVLVEEALSPEKELYLGIVPDSTVFKPVVMASDAGGMEIEEVAQKYPEKIYKTWAEPGRGVVPYQARELAFKMGLKGDAFRAAVDLIPKLYRLFAEKDCSLVEINPLALLPDGRLVAMDAKINFDDNALFRHPEIREMRDPSQEDPLEVEAKSKGIENYVRLDGDIGIVVNGAGLAMAVMDALKLAGGRPANFLDIGTVNRSDRVVHAFHILASDPNVKAVLVNIFGGMARVDVIAEGLVQAAKELGDRMPPTVVRLAGTNLAEGERILSESGMKFSRAYSFWEAAKKAVALARGEKEE